MENKQTSILGHGDVRGFNILLVLVWCKSIIMDYVSGVFYQLFGDNVRIFLMNAIYAIAFIWALPYIRKCSHKKDVLFFLTVVIIYALQFLIFPENTKALEDISSIFLVWVLPALFLGLGLFHSNSYKLLLVASIASLFCMIYYKMFHSAGYMEANDLTEDMDAAYHLLPHLLLIFYASLKEKKVLYYLCAAIGFILLLSFGTRGPIICAIVYLSLYFMLTHTWSHPIRDRILLIFGASFIILTFDAWSIYLNDVFSGLGLSTRLLSKFQDGVFFESNARDDIRLILINNLSESGFLGLGIAGDRTIIDTYAHNLILELWVSFGWFIGTFLIICLFYLLLRAYRFGTAENKNYLILLISCSVLHLMLSSTYLNSYLLFVLIGYSISVVRYKPQISTKS